MALQPPVEECAITQAQVCGDDFSKEEDETVAPSGVSTPAVKFVDSELDYPDGGLRAWLVALGSWGVFQSLYETERLQETAPSTMYVVSSVIGAALTSYDDRAWIGSSQYALVFFPGLIAVRRCTLSIEHDLTHARVGYLTLGISRCRCCFGRPVLVTSCFLIAECHQFWQYLLVQGIMSGLACGCLFGPALNAVTHWFKKRRSFAFGITAVGSSLGGTTFPILVRNLEREIGFKWALRVLGFIILALLTVANLTLKRRLPPTRIQGGVLNLQAFSNPAYSFYVASSFTSFFGIYAVLTYIDIAAVSHGISPDLSFYLVAIANAASGVGRFVAGVMGDRIGATNTMMPFTLVAAVLTYAWPFATTLRSIIAVAIIYVAHMGDIRDVGRRTGMQQTILAFGALAGPPTCGAIASAAGSYVPLGAFAASMVVIAVGLMWCSKRAATGHWIHSKF
ncbi:MFS general substrate transporter [Auriculariales sp. MPI-PUGE-AT-0066]|nr:MFS general substrate transporter [Auriculariales sp. MPI-PUGE-AT-0066]